jgi:hypothetical protein
MSLINLSKDVISSISTSVTNNTSIERSDSELFLIAYKEYKLHNKATRPHITKLLNEQVALYTKSNNVRNTLKRVFKLAYDYIDMRVICKFDSLEYTNISKLVKLFKYIDKHIPDKSNELRDTIASIYEEGISSYRYNNTLESTITELKEEYKLKEQEDEFVFVDVYNLVQSNINKMTDEQLLKLIELAQRNLSNVA